MTPGKEEQRLLIADDSAILNNMLRDLFEEDGFTVYQAFDGGECKSVFNREKPDVVLIDVHMPQVDGVEVLRYIKQRSPRTIVIVMTGAGSEKVAVRAMKFGADDYLNKPFGRDDVVALVRKLLDKRRAGEETRRLKNKIRQGEKYLAHLTTIINEALVTTDSRGRIEFINRAASNMWGYSPDELRGKDIHFLIRGEARTLLHRDLVKDTIRLGRVEGEFHFRRKDKGAFPGYLSTSVIREDRSIRGIVMVVADLTRLHEVERRLKQSEKLAALGKVVEGVAHEVRNCLTSLGGFALRLRNITAQDPTCSQYTRIIMDDVSRLESMVKEIEEYVRYSKFYNFHFVKTDLPPLIERARDRVLQKMPPEATRQVTFRLEAGKDLPQVSVDPDALEEVFSNLIMNAFEAMPRGGKLTVSIKGLKSAVSVAVTDTGVGIHEKDLADIFNPFFTSKTTGAGMGLSRVYLVVEEHRGTVTVVSTRAKGTTVEVFLPMEHLITGPHPWEAASRGGPP